MLFDILYPKMCVGCGLFGNLLCLRCKSRLDYSDGPILHSDSIILGHCGVFQYRGIARKAIVHIKYHRMRSVLDDLFLSIDPVRTYGFFDFAAIDHNSVLVPIPLHKKRQDERGYNQAYLIACYFGYVLGMPVRNILMRTRYTAPQAQISTAADRIRNIAGAFAIKQNVEIPSTAVLVDDVYTSGSTSNEAAKILHASGVRHIYVFSLACE